MENSFFEKVLKDQWVPSLQHVAATRIVRLFMYQPNFVLRQSIPFQTDHLYYNSENIMAKIALLPLPKKMKAFLNYFVDSVACELLSWIDYYNSQIFCDVSNSNRAAKYTRYIIWSPRGHINYVETGKTLLQVEDISPLEKYKICCYFCLTEEMVLVGQSVLDPEYVDGIDVMYEKAEYYFTWHLINNHEEFVELICEPCERRDRLLAPRNYVIGYGINAEVMGFMWQQINDTEKLRFLSCDLYYELNVRKVCAILVRSGETIIQRMVEEYLLPIFEVFFKDPLRLEFALPFVRQYSKAMTKEIFAFCMSDQLLRKRYRRVDRVLYGGQVSVLEQMWDMANVEFKEYALKGGKLVLLLRSLSWKRSKNFVKKILSRASDSQRRNMICSLSGEYLCKQFLRGNQLKYLNLFVERGLSGGEDVRHFKAILKEVEPEYFERYPTSVMKYQRWMSRKFPEEERR